MVTKDFEPVPVAQDWLSSRLRPDIECAPWVVEAVKKMEADHASRVAELEAELSAKDEAYSLQFEACARLSDIEASLSAFRADAEREREAAYDAGFMASAEGWNGEYGPDTGSRGYLQKRAEYFAAIAQGKEQQG